MADETLNGSVLRPNGRISPEQCRVLLRRIRDLNLGHCGIDVAQGERVLLSGCISIDHPVELGVRYVVQDGGGVERILAIHCEDGYLRLLLRRDRRPDSPIVEELSVELGCDGLGRVAAPELAARIDLDVSEAREVEHFLRRIVRAVYTKAS